MTTALKLESYCSSHRFLDVCSPYKIRPQTDITWIYCVISTVTTIVPELSMQPIRELLLIRATGVVWASEPPTEAEEPFKDHSKPASQISGNTDDHFCVGVPNISADLVRTWL